MKTRQAPATWEQVARRLEHEGWNVRCTRVWLAEARREGHIEQATGTSRDAAFAELCQLTLLDTVDGCP